jgi:hypothetical protein
MRLLPASVGVGLGMFFGMSIALVEYLLRDGKEDEAVRVFDRPLSFFPGFRADQARRFCNDGYKVMCGRANASERTTGRT